MYCTYASTLGHCLIDGDLYVQEHWTKDPERCERAGLGRDFVFRTKTQGRVVKASALVASVLVVTLTPGEHGRRSPVGAGSPPRLLPLTELRCLYVIVPCLLV